MKRRMLAGMLAMLLCLGILTACKKNVGTPEDNAVVENKEDDSEEEIYKFGFSCITMQNPYFITLEASIREEVEKRGHILITEDPALDAELQIRQINDMIDHGIQAIFLTPVDWDAITPALEALKKADVKIINVDTQVKEMSYVDAYVGSDNKNAGMICAEDLIEKCPNGGKVLILECPTMNSINDRITGFEEGIAAKGFEIVARKDVHGDLQEAIDAVEEVLQKYDGVIAIMCGNDEIAQGALVAVKSLKQSNILIYGVDGSPDLKKELQKNDTLIAGTAAQSPINMGKEAVKVAFQMMNGEEYEKETYEEVFFIDKRNVGLYGSDGWQ